MFKELIIKLGKSFNKASVPYMIIGGQAVLLYGEPRFTRDIDITLGIGADGLDGILNIVKALNLKTLNICKQGKRYRRCEKYYP